MQIEQRPRSTVDPSRVHGTPGLGKPRLASEAQHRESSSEHAAPRSPILHTPSHQLAASAASSGSIPVPRTW